jgi:hypothetical protein
MISPSSNVEVFPLARKQIHTKRRPPSNLLKMYVEGRDRHIMTKTDLRDEEIHGVRLDASSHALLS